MELKEVIEGIDSRLLKTPEGRRALTRLNPLLFAVIYLPHKLKDSTGAVTLSEFHVALSSYGKQWATKDIDPNGHWSAHIAPRGCGKSTWLFHILPIWAAAFGHKKFAAAFSDAANQAEGHLLNFKMELRTNPYLNDDFPELCELMRGKDGLRWQTQHGEPFGPMALSLMPMALTPMP